MASMQIVCFAVIWHVTQEQCRQEGISSKKRKRKTRDDDPVLEMIAKSMNTVAEAFVKFSTEIVKNQTTRVMSENEIYMMVKEMQVDESIFDEAYLYLIDNVDAQRALKGYPPQRRMRILTKLLSRDG